MKSKEPHKIKISKEIFYKTKATAFNWSDIKHIEFEDDDKIEIGYDDGHVSENESWDPYHFASVTRLIEETDEEFEERQREIKVDSEWMKQRRYETYLKLKAEFENETN